MRLDVIASRTTTGELPESPAAIEAAIKAADELRKLERDWRPIPAERCRCSKPWLERWPRIGPHCGKCGHDVGRVAPC
jgi:hypothetical protein